MGDGGSALANIEGRKFVKHFEDLAHAIPPHVLRKFHEWADDHKIKPVDFSGDGVITDHYPFGKGVEPGGFSITVAEEGKRWKWLAIGPGINFKACLRALDNGRYQLGDSLGYYRKAAGEIRVMRWARTCKIPELDDMSKFDAVFVRHGYSFTGTMIVSHLQFEPGVVDLIEEIGNEPEVLSVLSKAMKANPYNAVFAVNHFPEHASGPLRDAVIGCVRNLPLIAHRFPPGFLTLADVDGDKCGAMAHMLPVDQLCKTIDDVESLFFGDESPITPIPWRWVRRTFGPDAVDRLVARIPPIQLFRLPTNMRTPERVDRWIQQYERRNFVDWGRWCPDAESLDDADQFQRLVAKTGRAPPNTAFFVDDDWWTTETANIVAMAGRIDNIPEHLLTYELLAAFVKDHRYEDVPEHLRTPELDKESVLETSDHLVVVNYVCAAVRTIEMTRMYAEKYARDLSEIPGEHFDDDVVVRNLCDSSGRWTGVDELYAKIPERRWPDMGSHLAKTVWGFECIPKDKVTDELSRLAPITAHKHMTPTVQGERAAEFEAHTEKIRLEEEKERLRRHNWSDDDIFRYNLSDGYESPPASEAYDAIRNETGNF